MRAGALHERIAGDELTASGVEGIETTMREPQPSATTDASFVASGAVT